MPPRPAIPALRIRATNDAPVRAERDFVLYWQIAARRTRSNFALDHAIHHATTLGKPLVVLEALRCGYRWASDRMHRFVLDGMRDNRARYAKAGITYHAYVEPKAGAGSGLLEHLAGKACMVVTDDYPAFFLPRMVEAAAKKLDVRLDAVDGNGLLPMRATDRVFGRAVDLRRYLQKHLLPHLAEMPHADPLQRLKVPALDGDPLKEVRRRWPAAADDLLEASGTADGLADLPIDHDVPVVEDLEGGETAGRRCLQSFFDTRFGRYHEDRNHPDDSAASGLSPYLHFGFVSAHEVFRRLVEHEDWTPDAVATSVKGQREGFWGMSEPGEAFLDEFVTWRELGINMCWHWPDDYDRYDSLPEWARKTLGEHASDPRPYEYSHEELENAATHDEVWNAAQNELRATGRMHNYLRMLWGKKVLEWSSTPQEAAERLIELNNRWAIDGRDPNSYSGIFWVFGRYDRPWGPERPVFGTIRYMTSDSTKRKLRLKSYLARWAEPGGAKARGQGALFGSD
jgi:deoxyribodipyrimidine photo-lyase